MCDDGNMLGHWSVSPEPLIGHGSVGPPSAEGLVRVPLFGPPQSAVPRHHRNLHRTCANNISIKVDQSASGVGLDADRARDLLGCSHNWLLGCGSTASEHRDKQPMEFHS